MNKRNGESGAVIIEATISLSTFMFAIVTILTILNICMVQAKMSIAINAAAKELSQYSYLYAITGLMDSHATLKEAGEETRETVNKTIGDVNTVFTEIQNIGQSVKTAQPQDLTGLMSNLEMSGEKIKESGSSIVSTFEELAKDPKGAALGLVKVLANDGWNFALSKIAEGLSKGLCKRNLVFEKGGDPEAYLKFLGVVPAPNGSYVDGLDFSGSYMFPDGSSEICVNVEYDVHVIALLPIDFSFRFNQSASTHGWLDGKNKFRTDNTKEMAENNTLWTDSTSPKERQDFIRHQVIGELEKEGYKQITGSKKGDSYSDIHVYNPGTNEFAVVHSMNPLKSDEGERTITIADLNEKVIREEIEKMCSGISSTASSLSKIKTKSVASGSSDIVYGNYACEKATTKVVLVIPEDEGLKEFYEKIISDANTRGVTVELSPSYGNGAKTSEVKKESKEDSSEEGGAKE